MYQPGMDQGQARIRYAEMVEAAAQERAHRQAQPATAKQTVQRWVIAAAAAAPVVVWIIWAMATH